MSKPGQTNKTCPICKKPFTVQSYKPRNTCSSHCRKQLMAQTEKARQAKIKEREQADPLRTSMVVRSRMVDSVPRRKCPVCLQRVRLVNSVASAVWLRAHRGVDGQFCSGSRHVVSYPKEIACNDE